MYFVIQVLAGGQPLIIGDTREITEKDTLIETIAKTYVIKNYGSEYKNILIENADNIVEPLVDTVKIYKTNSDNSFHIYRRSSIVTPGYVYGQTIATEFKKIITFYLVEYANSNITYDIPLTFIPTEVTGIKVPHQMKFSPVSNLLEEIKDSSLFKNQKLKNTQ